MNLRMAVVWALLGAGCLLEDGTQSLPSVLVSIPQESQATLGCSSLFLSSDGKLYISGGASGATYDYGVRELEDSATSSALVSDANEPGRQSRALTGDNPIIRRRVAIAILASLAAGPQGTTIDEINYIFGADSTMGVASVTTNRQGAAVTVQATAATAAGNSPPAGATAAIREDHSACFGAAYEGGANAKAFCDCYYGAGSAASAECVPLRQASEGWLAERVAPNPNGLVSCSLPKPVRDYCTSDYFCCQKSGCWACVGSTPEEKNFNTIYCNWDEVSHCP